eukprot:m.13073 g.13073  ORF g.13073 m.13073 type:complete len:426 (-) comp10089_c0_seq2:1309-2586(-)
MLFVSLIEEAAGFVTASALELWNTYSSMSLAVSSCVMHEFAPIKVVPVAAEARQLEIFSFETTANQWQHNWFVGDKQSLPSVLDTLDSPNAKRHLLPTCIGIDCDSSCPDLINWQHLEASGAEWKDDQALIFWYCVIGGILSAILLYITRTLKFGNTLLRSLNRHVHARREGHSLYKHKRAPSPAISIEVQCLSYSIGAGTMKEVQLLNEVTFTAEPCTVTAIMGPSGSGKTTLLDLMTFRRNIGTITSGDININGCSTTRPATVTAYKQKLAYVEQLQGAYFADLTVGENMVYAAMLRLPSTMSMDDKMERAAESLAMLGLQERADVLVGDASAGPGLSGGQKRKLAVAMELLHDPTVLAMDEPTSGLDAAGVLEMMDWLNDFAAQGRTVILSVHQPRPEVFVGLVLLLRWPVARYPLWVLPRS